MQLPSVRNLKNNFTRFLYGQSGLYNSFGRMQENQINLDSYDDNRDSFKGLFFRLVQMRANNFVDGMNRVTVNRQISQDQNEQVEASHPWVTLLRRPSPAMSRREFYNWMFINIDLIGHADMYAVRNNRGVVESLLPIFNEFGDVYPQPNAFGGVDGWVFWRSDGQRRTFEADEIIRVKRGHPATPFESFSLVEAAVYQLDVDKYMKEYRRDSVNEGGLTSVVLSTDQQVNKEQRAQIGQEFKEYLGKRGLGKVFVGHKSLKPENFAMSAKDLEYIEGEIQNWSQLAFITGVPEAKFAKDSNRATSYSAEKNFIQDSIQPELDNAADQLSVGLEDAFGADRGVLFLKSPDLTPLDEELEIKRRESYIRTGQRIINEYRAEDGKDDLPGGDTAFINGTLVPLEQAAQQQPARPPARSVKKKVELREYDEEQLAAEWRAIDKKKRIQENQTIRSVNDLFESWREQIQEALEKKRSAGSQQRLEQELVLSVEELFSEAEANGELEDKLSKDIRRMLKAGFNNGIIAAGAEGLEFTFNDNAREALDAIVNKTKNITTTTREQLSGVVDKAMREGESVDGLAKRIDDLFDDIKTSRTPTIAQTMATPAFEGGQQVAYDEAGVEEKRWLSQRDGLVRDPHLSADGQTVQRHETFSVGGEALKYPGDPVGTASNVINCRCSTLPVKRDD